MQVTTAFDPGAVTRDPRTDVIDAMIVNVAGLGVAQCPATRNRPQVVASGSFRV